MITCELIVLLNNLGLKDKLNKGQIKVLDFSNTFIRLLVEILQTQLVLTGKSGKHSFKSKTKLMNINNGNVNNI